MQQSIRRFLLFYLLLVLAISTVLAGVGNYYLDQQDIYNNLDNSLSQAGLVFRALVGEQIKLSNIDSIQKRLDVIPSELQAYLKPLKDSSSGNEKYLFQVWNTQNKVLLHSAHAPTTWPLSKLTNGFSDAYYNSEHWRVFTSQNAQQNLTYAIAEHYGVRARLAHRITADGIYIMMVIYPLAGVLIWLIVGHALRTIRNVTDEVAQRAAEYLSPVDLESVPTEIQPLVDELNKLFLRLKQAFEREQRFAADAAHELRTPLAALKTQAQVALKATDAHERQQHLQNVITGVDRCTHVVQQLLTLCRLSPETVTLEEPIEVDMAKLAAEVVAQLAPTAIDKHIEIELIVQPEANYTILGHATGIHALIRNLVDNAIRYTPENGAIKVVLNKELEQIVLRVIDNGPGIPADLRSRVFERFFRVLGTNAQGSGLGLAIVSQIVNLHKGNVSLSVPKSGSGLEVKVTLPT